MGGMTTSDTKEETIFPNAAPMITPTAISTTFPLTANSLNSWIMLMIFPYWVLNQSSTKPTFYPNYAVIITDLDLIVIVGSLPHRPAATSGSIFAFRRGFLPT
jgi:hypothetical protein